MARVNQSQSNWICLDRYVKGVPETYAEVPHARRSWLKHRLRKDTDPDEAKPQRIVQSTELLA